MAAVASEAKIEEGVVKVEAAVKSQTPVEKPNIPPPKTDKPRPHVCATCTRSFARLEHLKRHERSHTKEKPFECPQCTRCFARRDLLLRHQQKLHQTGAPSSRLKHGRRGSMAVASPATNRLRKNSLIGELPELCMPNGQNGMRPRANTISHVGAGLPAFFASGATPGLNGGLHSRHASLIGFSPVDGPGMHMMPQPGSALHLQGLPKFQNTQHFNSAAQQTLRNMQHGLAGVNNPNMSLPHSDHPTINPAHLHFDGMVGSPGPMVEEFGMFSQAIEDDDFDWTGGLSESLLNVQAESAINGSSPSAISTASHGGLSEVFLDGQAGIQQDPNSVWAATMAPPLVSPAAFAVDPISAALYHELVSDTDTVSPHHMQGQNMNGNPNFNMDMNAFSASMESSVTLSPDNNQFVTHLPMSFQQENSAPIFGGQAWPTYHNSVTLPPNCTITETTRQAILVGLSQPSGFGHTSRRFSHTDINSPLSPDALSTTFPAAGLPNTANLQRYVNAYIRYFHPHLPFLHIPSLNFNQPDRTSPSHAQNPHQPRASSNDGCLILAMAALGASYEFEPEIGKELFEGSKKMIGQFLERRRTGQQRTPLWLVQATLLNLIYGHCCGDKVAADIATTSCASLIALAKAAQLDQPDPDVEPELQRLWMEIGNGSPAMGDHQMEPDIITWTRWKSAEGRRRTLFAVYVLSSILVSAFNHQPRIFNSELHMILPCEEDLWSAENSAAWSALGGMASASTTSTTFADALAYLLTAREREQNNGQYNVPKVAASRSALSPTGQTHSDLNISAFGCYVLINALHVYIWDTRQRHPSMHWRSQETEMMHITIAPALKAWQTIWESNPKHRLDWPSTSGPLPADCVPLLDLAYVRLFVNLGRSKEAFWARDFVLMAQELASGSEIAQHASTSRDGSPDMSSYGSNSGGTNDSSPSDGLMLDMTNGQAFMDSLAQQQRNAHKQLGQVTSRERHLRKAAFYAADSLSMADKMGLAFLELTSRELPIQAAMCQFDCAQVLAEWVMIVQERVGRYLGVLGRDEINLAQDGVSMLLEDEDVKLLQKVQDFLEGSYMKLAHEASNGLGVPDAKSFEQLRTGGFGSRLLKTTAYRLQRAAVWPVAHVMGQALLVHAEILDQRANASLPT